MSIETVTVEPTAAQASPDLAAPLLPQVAALGADYDAWVHRSVRPQRTADGRPGSLRIFRSDRLEAMSHIPWWLVLVVWVPVIVGLFVAASALGLDAPDLAGWAVAGLAFWTLVEYALHRFVFHWRPRTALGRRVHFLAHGIHHLDPWDPTRLVFPPVAGVIVASMIFSLIWLVLPLAAALATMAGLLCGYLVYDMTHYYTHHGRPRGRWGKFLKQYHLAHHHKHHERMFGVSQPLWDMVFRTGRPSGNP
jgi:dihydroceramide fatty acyl 2-hydroxylase